MRTFNVRQKGDLLNTCHRVCVRISFRTTLDLWIIFSVVRCLQSLGVSARTSRVRAASTRAGRQRSAVVCGEDSVCLRRQRLVCPQEESSCQRLSATRSDYVCVSPDTPTQTGIVHPTRHRCVQPFLHNHLSGNVGEGGTRKVPCARQSIFTCVTVMKVEFVHSRFVTNTSTAWCHASPVSFLCHHGEITDYAGKSARGRPAEASRNPISFCPEL